MVSTSLSTAYLASSFDVGVHPRVDWDVSTREPSLGHRMEYGVVYPRHARHVAKILWLLMLPQGFPDHNLLVTVIVGLVSLKTRILLI